jgi:hypothetical protein
MREVLVAAARAAPAPLAGDALGLGTQRGQWTLVATQWSACMAMPPSVSTSSASAGPWSGTSVSVQSSGGSATSLARRTAQQGSLSVGAEP